MKSSRKANKGQRDLFVGLTLTLAMLFMVSCGKRKDGAGLPFVANASAGSSVIIKGAGKSIGRVVGFDDNGFVLVYITSADRYATIDPVSGAYKVKQVLHSNSGCTGTAYVSLWSGELKKTVIFDGNNYWIAESRSVSGNSYPYQSSSGSGGSAGCNVQNGTATGWDGLLILSSAIQPFDFASVAPLSIVYE